MSAASLAIYERHVKVGLEGPAPVKNIVLTLLPKPGIFGSTCNILIQYFECPGGGKDTAVVRGLRGQSGNACVIGNHAYTLLPIGICIKVAMPL